MAARCVGVLSKIVMLETMNSFLECVLPWLAAIDDCTKQEGAIESLACILDADRCLQQFKYLRSSGCWLLFLDRTFLNMSPGVMEQLDVDIVPYIVLLVVPVLGRMSDPSDSIRFMATQCFATLIRLLPLEVRALERLKSSV